MERKSLEIYWQRACSDTVENVKRELIVTFPGLEPVAIKHLEPPNTAWDSSRGQYDAAYLINELEAMQSGALCLWVLDVNISYGSYSYLYGAASGTNAIVSAFCTGKGENFYKEASHEVGHMLGLSHCRENCVMHTSRNGLQLKKKSPILCRQCAKKLCIDYHGKIRSADR